MRVPQTAHVRSSRRRREASWRALALASVSGIVDTISTSHASSIAHTVSLALICHRTAERSPNGAWWVESECEPGKEYWVCQPLGHVWTCTCQDFQRRGGPCKHALAVRLLQACETREGGSPPPAPLAFPTRYYSDSDRFELTPLGEAVLEATAPTPAA